MITAEATRTLPARMKDATHLRPWTAAIVPGISAGLVAGFLIMAMTAISAHASPFLLLAGIANVALGKTPVAPHWASLVGLLLHFGVSLGWSIGYAVLALRTPQLVQAPLISGISYGLIVEMTMEGLLVMAGAFVLPTPSVFLRDVIAHTIGFGVPLAFIVAAYFRPHLKPTTPTPSL